MSKIFNWFFGSFFRTLGRIVVFLLLGYILFSFINISDIKLPNLFGVLNVNAQTILGDIEIGDWSSFTNGAFYNISSTDSIQNKGWELDSDGMVVPTSSITTHYNGYGMGMSICDLSLLTDNYYSITLLIGTDSNVYYHPFYVNRSTKLGISNNSSVWFTNFNYESLSDGVQQNYISYGQSQHIYLDSFTGIFKAPASGTCLNLAFSSNSTIDFYVRSFAIGYRLTSLGAKPLTQEQISNALSKDFENLNNSINNLSSGINETNNKLDDINSSINDSSSPNLDGLNNSAGWLPPGAIDGILNLPLTFLNSLTTNLSKTCNPVDLPLPFVDKTLTLPCVNSLYSQIDGLQVWINSISVIASAFILFRYLMNLYKWVDDTLTFRENNFIDNWSGV